MDTLLKVAMSYLHTPYKWGGDDPLGGLDCSGYIQEVLSTVGMDPPGDQTAQGLFDHFSKNGNVYPHTNIANARAYGSLAFYGENPKKITHVGFIVAVLPLRMLEAGGGGRTINNHQDAIKHNAFIRMRLVTSRHDLVAIIRPNYPYWP